MNFTILKRTLAALVIATLTVMGASPLYAQTQTSITTLSAAQTQAATVAQLTSATNAVVGSYIFVDLEAELITAITSTTATVQRGAAGTTPAAHANATSLLVGTPDRFQSVDPPFGTCTQGSYPGNAKPWVNVTTGSIWLCRAATNLWVGTNTQNLIYNSLTQQ